MLIIIISGGQTGADRAALDAALACSFNAGGYCPRARLAEDGPIPSRYPLVEIDGGYDDRTLKNVLASDATVVFFQNELTGGTALTLTFCIDQQSPYQLIDIEATSAPEAAKDIACFIAAEQVATLNIAGPRASDCPEMYSFVYATIFAILSENRGRSDRVC